MRTAIVTQARSTSTRLPGKVLLEASGRTFLDHHLDRLSSSGLSVIVATTTNDTDDSIAEIASARDVPVFRGSEHDVLSRYAVCAREFALDVIVRVTSDCPLIDGAVVREGVEAYRREDDPGLYLSNTLDRTFPRGFDYEVFSAALLHEADAMATTAALREHVTPYLHQNHNERTRLRNRPWPEDRSGYRVTLDTDDDLRLLRTLIEDHRAEELTCREIIALLDAHPELVAVNAHVEQRRHGG